MAPVLRLARAEDLPTIVELLADDVLGRQREDPGELAPYRAAFAVLDSDPHHELVVADLGGRVVGCFQLSVFPCLTYKGGRRAQIEGVRVASDLRGRGLGGALMRWAVQRARAHGCHMVQLMTDRARSGPRRFYESLGFVASHDGLKMHLD